MGTLGPQKKNRKVGRPKMPKGEAKGRIVPVRFQPEDLKRMQAAAKANNQSISEWVRNTIHANLSA
jgi:predicted HicB family RNase H-like nuclease